jgi:molybdopterin/thiamine biosynthesis adenylyltransferase
MIRTPKTDQHDVAGRVTVVGSGGNIGSQLVPHLVRLPGVTQLQLFDPGRYEEKDLRTQNIGRTDVGRAKSRIQARSARRVRPDLPVEFWVSRFEDVPPARLRAEVMVSCLDSRVGRMRANELAWRLGIPLIDGGVDAHELLARVNVFRPGSDENACLECGWHDEDYAALEQVYPCRDGDPDTAPTNAASYLGGLCAALQAAECQKILAGRWDEALVNRQVLVSMRNHKQYVTRFQRNHSCRFDHQTPDTRVLGRGPRQLTVAGLLAVEPRPGVEAPGAFRAVGDVFVRRLVCTGCGHSKDVWMLRRRWRASRRACRRCGGRFEIVGFDIAEWVGREALSGRDADRTLSQIGFAAGDLIALRNCSETWYFEVPEDVR